MFLPTTIKEVNSLGWDRLDVIIITGDTYFDSSYIGAAVIGRILFDKGYRVGIIAQPDITNEKDISRLGEPLLFWGVTSGSIDSMVANYTSTKKKRYSDDLTPGEINNKRPDRATIVYSNLIRRYFKNTVPIVLGGIEASLRRIAHYDYWNNSIRRSILFDSKADILVYGMGEQAVIELADSFKKGIDFKNINGICYISHLKNDSFIELPSFKESSSNIESFSNMFKIFYANNDPLTAKGLLQKHDNRFLIHNPPSFPLSKDKLDYIYNLPYNRDIHPYYKKLGKVRALDTIQFSITTHRGCYGECNFCAISVHQGAIVQSRSINSIIKEAQQIVSHPKFKGIINDIGGPTANMYEIECSKKTQKGSCNDKRCIYPEICNSLKLNHSLNIKLLDELRKISGIKKIFISSGIRYDLIIHDEKYGEKYLNKIINHHVSGQMKIAPEHYNEKILKLMGKPSNKYLIKFKNLFYKLNKLHGKNQFLTYYFIAAHPGCEYNDMKELNKFIKEKLHIKPEQVQIFTPTPSTYSTLMYYTCIDPFTNQKIYVEKEMGKMEKQKKIILKK